MTSSTGSVANGRIYTKARWQIISVAGIACCSMCLLTGICLIFTSSLVPVKCNVSGLWIGAALCAVGLCYLVANVVCLCKWQAKLGKISINVEENNDNAYSDPAIGCRNTHTERGSSHILKKANSTAFISFRPSSHLDKLTLVGVLHGTLSATEIRKPSRKELDMLNSLNYDFPHQEGPAGGTHKTSSSRDPLHSRRSLPRFIFHPFSGKTLIAERGPNRSLGSMKSESEGRQFEDVDHIETETTSSKPIIDQSPSPTESQLPEDPVSEVTHKTGQVSLFNLPAAITSAGQASCTNNTHIRDSRQENGLERSSSSGKRFLLMSQSGQVISCTTLFDGDDPEDERSSASNTTTTGCRRLQPCSGLNFFPVFVENAVETSGSHLTQSDPISDTEHLRSCTTLTRVCPQKASQLRPYRGLLVHMRRFMRKVLGSGKSREGQKEATQSLLSEPRNFGESPVGRHRSADDLNESSEPKEAKFSKLTFTELQSNHASTDDTGSQTSSQTTKNKRKHTVISNASVFSLPAVPPDKWLTERPLWIMGVPVDTCDFYLLKEQNQGLSNSAEHLNPTTGSSSSIYAFHVRPPARLKQSANNQVRYGRARSLGRFLNTDKG